MPKPPANSQKDLVGLKRNPLVNKWHAISDSLTKRAPYHNMHGLIEENKFTWLMKCLSHLGNKRYPYQVYAKPQENDGIFDLGGADGRETTDRRETNDGRETTIALLSDWASDTPESVNVASMVGPVDYSIHLGDTYYVGNSKEIADNFNDTFGAPWPYGSRGSFAMLGNHEMYSSGKSYFTELLPYMGIYAGPGRMQRQEASFFCLENDHWRVIGLDTGYTSLTGWFGWMPNPSMRLREEQLAWLRDTVRLGDDHRGIIFLSHHQPVSAFDKKEFRGFLAQLDNLLAKDRTVLWFCGHEHALALYGQNSFGEKLNGFTRCIGNGGMPVEIGHLVPKSPEADHPANRGLVLYDQRTRNVIGGNIPLGHNGFALLRLQQENLHVDYYDDAAGSEKHLVLTEQWVVDNDSGILTGVGITDHSWGHPAETGINRLTHFQVRLDKAIGK
jgi:hypothetical protein